MDYVFVKMYCKILRAYILYYEDSISKYYILNCMSSLQSLSTVYINYYIGPNNTFQQCLSNIKRMFCEGKQ